VDDVDDDDSDDDDDKTTMTTKKLCHCIVLLWSWWWWQRSVLLYYSVVCHTSMCNECKDTSVVIKYVELVSFTHTGLRHENVAVRC
jgi:hypothetical protein